MKISFTISLAITRDNESNDSSNILTDTSWRRLRRQIARRDEYRCHYCGTRTKQGHLDHVIPLSKGGTDEPDNLVWACIDCNLSKHDQTLEEWREADMLRHSEPDHLIDDDGVIIDADLESFYKTAQEIGTAVTVWTSELGRGRYQLYRDALIGHGLASWNSYKRDGTPNRNCGWSTEPNPSHQERLFELD